MEKCILPQEHQIIDIFHVWWIRDHFCIKNIFAEIMIRLDTKLKSTIIYYSLRKSKQRNGNMRFKLVSYRKTILFKNHCNMVTLLKMRLLWQIAMQTNFKCRCEHFEKLLAKVTWNHLELVTCLLFTKNIIFQINSKILKPSFIIYLCVVLVEQRSSSLFLMKSCLIPSFSNERISRNL